MRLLIPVLLICVLAACKNRTAEPAPPNRPPLFEQLTKTWLLSDYKALRRTAPGAASIERQRTKLLEAGVLFHFFANHEWVFVEGEQYHQGDWELQEGSKEIRCTYADKDSSQVLLFKIRRINADSLAADLTRNDQSLSLLLETDHRMYDYPEQCPWHPINNAWRHRPDHAETELEIKVRALNHLRHYHSLLEAAITNTPHTVSVKNSPSCIQLYTSGIGLRTADRIDAAWYATFFNRQDAEKCLVLLRKIIGTEGVFTGPKTRNWMQDDLTLLQRLMNRLATPD